MQIMMNLVPWGLIQTLVAGVILTYVLTPIYNALHISAQSKVRADMQSAINNALNYAIANAKGEPSDIMHDDALWNDLISVAKDYLHENASSLLQHLNVNTDSEITKALEAQVLNALNQWVFQDGQIKAITLDPNNAVPSTTVHVTANT